MVRYKCRYVLCKVVYADGKKTYFFEEKDVYNAVKDEVTSLHGDYAMASMKKTPSIAVRYIDKNSSIVLFKCQRGIHKLLQSALPFVKKIGKEQAFLQTIHVGGTIRSCLKFLIRYHKSRLPQLLMQCKTKDEKERVQAAIIKSCQDSTQNIMSYEKRLKPNESKS